MSFVDDGTMVYFSSVRPGSYGGMDRRLTLIPSNESISWFSTRSDNSLGNIDIFWTNKVNLPKR